MGFREGVTAEEKRAAHAAARMSEEDNPFFGLLPNTVRVHIPPGKEQESLNAYLDDPNVIYAQPLYLDRPVETTPTDPDWAVLWGMHRINLVHAWDVTTGDPNFTIGIVDSGLNYTHGDLAANVWTNPGEIPGNGIDDDNNQKVDDIHGWNFFANNNDITDGGELHGTHVAGTIGAVGNNATRVAGVNWNCKILMAACRNPATGGLANTPSALAYLLSKRVKVSNHSYVGPYLAPTETLLRNAQAWGPIAVCGAGNDHFDNDISSGYYPASLQLDNVIAVAASGLFDELADFSNYGATSVDLAAPGFSILSTGALPDETQYKEGTSMASPHVAGLIGLIWSRYPSLTWWQMRERILTGVAPIAALNGKVATGGRLDAARSMAVFTQPGSGTGVGFSKDPYRSFSQALSRVPSYGQLYIVPPTSAWSWTSRLDGSPKRIEAWGGPVRIGP